MVVALTVPQVAVAEPVTPPDEGPPVSPGSGGTVVLDDGGYELDPPVDDGPDDEDDGPAGRAAGPLVVGSSVSGTDSFEPTITLDTTDAEWVELWVRTVGLSSWSLVNGDRFDVDGDGRVAYGLSDGDVRSAQGFEWQARACTDADGCSATTGVERAFVNPAVGAGARRNASVVPFALGSGELAVGVDVGTGALKVSMEAMTVPGVVDPLAVGLVYDSKQLGAGATYNDAHTAFGRGWLVDVGADVRLVEHPDGDVTLIAPGGNVSLFTANGNGEYLAPAETRADLTQTAQGWEVRWRETGALHTFDGAGRLVSTADRNGNQVEVGYVGASRRMSQIVGNGGPAAARTVTVTQLAGSSEPRIARLSRQVPGDDPVETTFGYTGTSWQSLLTSVTDAEGRTFGFGYASNANLTEIVDPAGNRIVVTYDTSHRVTSLTQVTGPYDTGATTRFVYEAGATVVADANQDLGESVYQVAHTRHELDHRRRVTATIDPDGNRREKSYSPFFDIATATDALGATITNAFEANDGQSLTSTTSATGSVTSFGYGLPATSDNPTAAYQMSSTTNPRGSQTTFGYSPFGNASTSAVDALAAEASVVWDDDGVATASITPMGALSGEDPDDHTTGYVHNADRQLIRVEPPADSSLGDTLYTYDTRGRLATVDPGSGIATGYGYDQLDRVVSETTADNDVAVTYSYDAAGNVATRISGEGTTAYHYDPRGLLVRIDRPVGGTTFYTYDAVGNLTSVTDARGTTVYGYDDRNLLVQMTVPGPNGDRTSVFAYDDNGQRTDAWHAVDDPADPDDAYALHTQVSFDGSGRIARLTSTTDSGATTVQDSSYCYVAGITPGHGTCPTGSSTADTDLLQWRHSTIEGTVTYTYDGAGRLAEADHTDDGVAGYGYDVNGNRTHDTLDSQTVQEATFNPANQIDTLTTGTTTVSYSYDGAGNLLDTGSDTYSYTSANQLASTGAGTEVAHDGANQHERTRAGTVGQQVVVYVNGLLGVEAHGPVGNLYDIDRDPAGGQPLAFTDPNPYTGGVHYYLTDHLGSVLGLISEDGVRTATYRYDPYREIGRSGPLADVNLTTYAAGIGDPDSGLIKFGARYYDPGTGRWTQQDVLNAPLDPLNANRYAYAACNPVNYTDPTGMFLPSEVECALGIVALIAGVTALVLSAIFTGGASLAVKAAIYAATGIDLAIGVLLTLSSCLE